MREMTKNYIKYIIFLAIVIGCLLAMTQLVHAPAVQPKHKIFAFGVCYSVDVSNEWVCLHHHSYGRFFISSYFGGIRNTYLFSGNATASICLHQFNGNMHVWRWRDGQHIVLAIGEHLNMKVMEI